MNILICSIVRNEARHLDRWYNQIKRTVEKMPEVSFFLSVFENDSNDGSSAKLASYDWSFLPSYVITTSKLNAPFFIGGKEPIRTEILAFARNQSIYHCPFLSKIDNVVFIEPDIEYSHETISTIINHEKVYGKKFDVFCGKSVHPNTDNIYDSWGTRKTKDDTDWKESDGQNWELSEWWSAFHCLVIYNAEPIKRGLAFTGINPRTQKPDCDTVNIVESFRIHGYNKIYSDSSLKVIHYCN